MELNLENENRTLRERKQDYQEEIDGYKAIPGYKNNERIRLQLEITYLNIGIIQIKEEIIQIRIALRETTTPQEIKEKETQIENKEQLILINKQLILRLLPPQEMVMAQQGNYQFKFQLFIHLLIILLPTIFLLISSFEMNLITWDFESFQL